ncbi:efflux RND transporter periplasmic adaptor subunit [Massiliimalia massiliensis]|uniref:efflux RND transporter periplasmic adaptor subunit n=1 Tax=Massiliimalia massiliensis TaxID=1852384 RepID=UPI0009869EBF|nr:efflux RND transporter periplasmic adaptor subunit [Massiliimalia massiliensis]
MVKRMSILLGATVLLMAAALSLPQIVTGAVLHDVTVVQPTYSSYYDKISATGKIEAVSQSSLTTQLPLVPKEVFVNLGDTVKNGDVIAEIDFEESKQALLALLSLYDAVPDELSGVLQSIKIDQEQLEALIPSQITADFSGVISALNLTKGSVTQPTETVATIADLEHLRAVLRVPEDYAAQLKRGQEVTLKMSALDQKKYHGTVQTISPAAKETMVGTTKQTVVDVYVSISDQDSALKSGYTTVGTIRLNDTQELMTIPYSAIDQQDSGSEYVYLYQDGQAKMRVIATGQELANSVEVVGGLKPDEWIIEDISQVSHDGEYVNLAVN